MSNDDTTEESATQEIDAFPDLTPIDGSSGFTAGQHRPRDVRMNASPNLQVVPKPTAIGNQVNAIAEQIRNTVQVTGHTAEYVLSQIKQEVNPQGEPSTGWNVENLGQWDFEEILRRKPELAITTDGDGNPHLEMGDIIAILGKSKSQKSFASMQMALCVSAGIPLWGSYRVPEPKDVLIVQFEVKAEHYNKRIIRMAEGLGIDRRDIGKHLDIVNARGFTGELEHLRNNLLRDGKGKELIVVDPLYALLNDDENNPKAFKPVFNVFREVSEETGAAIAFIHHDGKGKAGDRESVDRGVGSGILGRFYDNGILLTEHKDNTPGKRLVVLDFVCRNREEPEPFTLEFDRERLMFVPSELAPEKRTSRTDRENPTNSLPINSLLQSLYEHLEGYQNENPLGDYKTPKEIEGWLRTNCQLTQKKAREVINAAKVDKRFNYQTAPGRKSYIMVISNPSDEF